MTVKASDIPFGGSDNKPIIRDRIFRERGEQRYSLEILPAGITFDIDRIKRHSDGVVGELMVTVNGSFGNARTVDGILSLGDLNVSSVQARGTRARLLADRSGVAALDWHGFLEEFCIKVIAAERAGKPAVILADELPEDEDKEAWNVQGFPILRSLPMVIFGDGSSGKSYFAIWLAGLLANQGIPVLYADWEFSKQEHRKRLGRLFQPMPKDLFYVKCDKSIREESDRIGRLVRQHHIQYFVCDSIGFAVEGPAEKQEGATEYFRCIRQFGVGSLNVGHVPKQYGDDAKDAQIFGSNFFKFGARSVWFVQRAEQNPSGSFQFGLYHRKSNVGELLAPRGFKLTFRGDRTIVEKIEVTSVDELAATLPLIDRMKQTLSNQILTVKSLAEDLGVSVPTIRAMRSRHKSTFRKVGENQIALIGGTEEF